MLRGVAIIVLVSISLSSSAQSSILEKVWTTAPSMNGFEGVNVRVNKLVTSVESRSYRSDVRKLHTLFNKTHRRFLRSYIQYTGIEGLVKGNFDCLTATSLFADVLEKTGFDYKIIETNYHIFIMVHTHEGDVILETTDRFGGFISDKKEIARAISKYQRNTLTAATPSHYQYAFSLYQSIGTDRLAGLLYFNQAVKAFNKQSWNECSEKLSEASKSTDSPRIAELVELLDMQR